MRETQNSIISNPVSGIINDYLYQNISVEELDANAWEYENTKVTSRYMDANTAISTLISKMSVFNGVTDDFIFSMYELTLQQLSTYERAFFFSRKNCNGVIRDLQEDTANYLVNYSSQFFTNVVFVNILIMQ